MPKPKKPKKAKAPTAKTPRTPGGFNKKIKHINPNGPWGGMRKRQKELDKIMSK